MRDVTKPRRPERDLEVLWQRHLPQSPGSPTTRMVAIESLAEDAKTEMHRHSEALDRGDLVITISVRPLEAS